MEEGDEGMTRWLKAPVFPSGSGYTKCIQLFEPPLSAISYFLVLPVALNFKPLIRRILDLLCTRRERIQRLCDTAFTRGACWNTFASWTCLAYNNNSVSLSNKYQTYLRYRISIENNFLALSCYFNLSLYINNHPAFIIQYKRGGLYRYSGQIYSSLCAMQELMAVYPCERFAIIFLRLWRLS